MIGKNPFRTTRDAYLSDRTLTPHPYLLGEVIAKAGRRILDYGCATGLYLEALRKAGFECVGADVNEDYLARVREAGFSCMHASALEDLPDRSFDSAILFDVLEHVDDPKALLLTASRLTRATLFVSVPNNEGAEALNSRGMTFAHNLDLDHRHFFTYDLLDGLLRDCFSTYRIERIDRIASHAIVQQLHRLRIVREVYYSRLYAEVEL